MVVGLMIVPRVTSVPVWSDAKSPAFRHDSATFTVLGLFKASLKYFFGLAAEARSVSCMKAYLVNACDPVLTVLLEFNHLESDPAQAAQLIPTSLA